MQGYYDNPYPATRYAYAVATLIAADDKSNRSFTPDVDRITLNQRMDAAGADWQKNLVALWGNNAAGIEQLWAECNDSYVELDGSVCVFPNLLTDVTTGVWSEHLVTDPELEDGEFRMFAIRLGGTYEIDTVTIVFDEAAQIYATDFNLFALDADDSSNSILLSVTHNSQAVWTGTFNRTIKTEYIYFNCAKMNVGNAHPRFAYLVLGQIARFTPDEIVSLRVSKEISLTAESAPAGEMVLEVVNTNRQYDTVNPTGMWKYITEGNTIAARIGVGKQRTAIEHFNAGVYIVDNIKASDDGLTVIITAHDPFYSRMDDAFHMGSAETMRLQDAISLVLQACGMDYLPVSYASGVSGRIVTLRADWDASCRDVIRQLCQAARVVPRFTEDGTLSIGDITGGSVRDTISAEILHDFPSVFRSTRVSQMIGKFQHVGATRTEEATKLYEGGIQNGETWVSYSSSAYTLARGATHNIPAANLVSIDYYLRGAKIHAKGISGDLNILITSEYDCPLYESEHSYTNTHTGERRHSHSVTNACVYPTYAYYQPFLQWLYEKIQYAQLSYQFTDRGNPARQVGDTVQIALRKGGSATAIIEKLELIYDGTLSCETTAAGIPS